MHAMPQTRCWITRCMSVDLRTSPPKATESGGHAAYAAIPLEPRDNPLVTQSIAIPTHTHAAHAIGSTRPAQARDGPQGRTKCTPRPARARAERGNHGARVKARQRLALQHCPFVRRLKRFTQHLDATVVHPGARLPESRQIDGMLNAPPTRIQPKPRGAYR